MNVLVTGGTGTVGRIVVMQLRQKGHRARILSRNPRGHVDAVQGDLSTGAGLAKAVQGMDAIVHAATQPRRGHDVDVKGTRHLIEAAKNADVKHIVYISIVGIDKASTFPYYKTKLKTEGLVRENVIPWSILRATQFHNLMETYLQTYSKVPGLTAIPFHWQFQPIDPSEVARRLIEIVLGNPQEMADDFGGPEVHDFKSIATAWLGARKAKRKLVNLPIPTKFNKQFEAGALTCPDHRQGRITFEQYLKEKYA